MNFIMKFWILLNFIAGIYCVAVYIARADAQILCFIPFLYSILFLLMQRSRRLFGKLPGRSVIMVVMFIRYVISPVVICLNNRLSIYAKNYDYMTLASLLIMYEMVALSIVLEITAAKAHLLIFDTNISNSKTVIVKPSFLIGASVVVILAAFYFTNRDLVSGLSLITQGTVYTEEPANTSSMIKILWQCLTTWIYVYLINRQKDLFEFSHNKKHVWISTLLTLLFIFVSYLGQTSISRWYTLVVAITSLFLLLQMYGSFRNKILVAILVPLGLLMISASLFKSGIGIGNKGVFSFDNLINPSAVDSYFAGPVSVNNAIGLAKNTGASIYNIFYDFVNNMPVVNHWVNTKQSTAYMYNEYIGRIFGPSNGDQIIPLVGQSYLFFSGFFAPLLSVISVVILNWADCKQHSSSNFTRYVWTFTAVWFGLETILSMTINLSWVYIRIIPLAIVFKVIEILSPKKKDI